MIVSLFDYGTGNLHSLQKAMEAHGATVRVDADPAAVLDADAMVLPGVGAFGAAAKRLTEMRGDIVQALEDGFPCLGVCLGMQLLFDESDESPGRGLGFMPGRVRRLQAARRPQMGWNVVETSDDPLFREASSPIVYYANTFVAEPEVEDSVIAWTTYDDDRFAAAVRRNKVWGVQFHPEKSAAGGLRMIGNFLREAGR